METNREIDLAPGERVTDAVEVRTLAARDLEWVVAIDREHSGRWREAYYRLKLAESETDTGIRISLAALVAGQPAGFLMGRLYYGEFGVPEPVMLLDSIGVSRGFARQHVGRALLEQLRMNLRALGIAKVQTQVDWDQLELLGFFQRMGFRPAARLCLDLEI